MSSTSGPASLVITGARLWSPGPGLTGPVTALPVEAALAVSGDTVVAIGDQADVLDLAGPATRRLHLPGRLVLPGFQDAHVHPPFAGRYRMHLSLHDAGGLDDCLAEVARYAASRPEVPWIFGAGWPPECLPGTVDGRALLDAVVPDRPVFLFDSSIHSAWVNSRALQLAGITAATPDPVDGRIRRHPGGSEPTGLLDEGAAYTFEARHLPAPGPAEWRSAILHAQSHLHSLGVTGWQDAWVTPDTLGAYAGLVDDGRLTARVAAALWWERSQGLEQVEGFIESRRTGARSGRLLARTVKIMTDGVIENGTAGLLSPYHDACGGPTADHGLTYLEPERLTEAVTRLDRLDFQVHLHTIGDRAVRIGLDAVEAARRANGPRGNRHHLAHLQVVQPVDVPRFAALAVVANCQAYWAQSDPMMQKLTVPVLGAHRSSLQYPFADLAAAGTVLAMGSDWAVSTADPLRQVEVALTRTDPGARSMPPFLPEQRLSLGVALRAFTAGSAFVNHDPDGGHLRIGARADLVVLDRDVFTDPALAVGARIADARVEFTVASGRVVHAPDGSPDPQP